MEQETSSSDFNLKKCFICRKSLNTKHNDEYLFSYKSDNLNLCKLFLSLAFRYIKFENSDLRSHETLNLNLKSGYKERYGENQGILENVEFCCKICEPLLGTFCELYDQLILVKLHLNNNLEKIAKLIEPYNNGNTEKPGNPTHHNVSDDGSWRKPFVAKVYSKFKKFPLLKLTRIERKTETNHQYDPVDEDDHQPDNVDLLQTNLDLLPEKTNLHHHDHCDQQLGTTNPNLVPNTDKPFKCQYCSKSFYHNNSLSTHQTASHLKQLRAEKHAFKRSNCDKGFGNPKNLFKKHISNNQTPIKDSLPDINKRFRCQYCPKSFSHQGNLVLHQAISHEEKNCQDERLLFKCRKCAKSFVSRDTLMTHQAEQHGLTKAAENSTIESLNEGKKKITVPTNAFAIITNPKSCGNGVTLIVDDKNSEIPISIFGLPKESHQKQTTNETDGYNKGVALTVAENKQHDQETPISTNQHSAYIPLTRPTTETQTPYSSYIQIPPKTCRQRNKNSINHIYTGEIPYECPQCHRKFKTGSGCRDHLRKLHKIVGLPVDALKVKRSETPLFNIVQSNTSGSIPPEANNLTNKIMEIDEGQVFQAKTEKVHPDGGIVEVEDKAVNHADVDNFILPDKCTLSILLKYCSLRLIASVTSSEL